MQLSPLSLMLISDYKVKLNGLAIQMIIRGDSDALRHHVYLSGLTSIPRTQRFSSFFSELFCFNSQGNESTIKPPALVFRFPTPLLHFPAPSSQLER